MFTSVNSQKESHRAPDRIRTYSHCQALTESRPRDNKIVPACRSKRYSANGKRRDDTWSASRAFLGIEYANPLAIAPIAGVDSKNVTLRSVRMCGLRPVTLPANGAESEIQRPQN